MADIEPSTVPLPTSPPATTSEVPSLAQTLADNSTDPQTGIEERAEEAGPTSPETAEDSVELSLETPEIERGSLDVERTDAGDSSSPVITETAAETAQETEGQDAEHDTPKSEAPELPEKPAELSQANSSSKPALTNVMRIQVDAPTRRDTIPVNGSNPASPSPSAHRRMMTVSRGSNVSVVLISSALETIAASKEARRSQQLKDSTQHALDLINANQGGDRPREVLEPLRLACETRNEKLMIASLDCISKLISYSFFNEVAGTSVPAQSPPASPNGSASEGSRPPSSLVDLVVHTVTSCHSETTTEAVSLQIVKALLALVLSSTVLVHHSSLLKAVRTVYNVFLLSTDPVNQMVAQGGLTQMVHHIFTRCKGEKGENGKSPAETPGSPRRASRSSLLATPSPSIFTRPLANEGSTTPQSADTPATIDPDSSLPALPEGAESATPTAEKAPPITLNTFEAQVPRASLDTNMDAHAEGYFGSRPLSDQELFVKDAFLVFRAMCKLTMKPLNNDSERDLKSHAMRSKLLSLHIVLTILNSHMSLIVDPSVTIVSSSSHESTSFVQAINQYLCLCLSRNAVSPVPQVFDLSVEIFWRVLSGMRTKLKKEIEVLLHEIFIPILEMRTSTLKQKGVILGMLVRLCEDPQALVEIYLNYDCDGDAQDNIYEHLMNIITKIGSTPMAPNSHNEPASPAVQPTTKHQSGSVPPALTTSALSVSGSMDTSTMGLTEAQLRRQGLECVVAVLRSLVAWGTATGKVVEDTYAAAAAARTQNGDYSRRDSVAGDVSADRLSVMNPSTENLRQLTPDPVEDDPSRFENAKQKKTTLLEGIKKFNFKPKRGVQFLVETGFIRSAAPRDVAHFLLTTEGLNKAMIGEYLGEGDPENVAIMHAFVDFLDFRSLPFVDALRTFLQSFRLPGESQKIDRFMLKFAERYVAGNPQASFANADTAYVLSYSTIMLNTDAHSPQVKKRMSKAEFIKNNRGINDNADLPDEFLGAIFDEIVNNEIRMKDEVEAIMTPAPTAPGIANAIANVGRDLQKEAYVMQTSGMANKTEALFRTMMRSQRRGSQTASQFYSASQFVHVRPMFEVAWIPFLAGLSGPLQDSDDMEIIELCLDGFKSAIHIVCFFDLELQRNAFVTTLGKFTFLNNLGEMKSKNMEAIKTLLDVAVTEGNNLKSSWHEVLTCVSQLEHMQLISGGVDVDSGKKGKPKKAPTEELANESRSTHITVATDMVFSLSHFLSGTAIVDFVQALCSVSWEEIQSSGLSQHPRLFSLQKLVEISYYNMNRIRLEWSNLWDILGEHFNQVCCHNNPHVGFFALDSLRQLAMRFLEKEELPHFKFQKDFLKPFEHTMTHNANPEIRDMVLQCLQQMIQARAQNLRSGWRTMFGVFQAASRVLTERIASSAFEVVTRLNKEHFPSVVRHGAFADLTVCITEFCKVSKYQKISLLAIGMLRGVIPVMLASPECGWKIEEESPETRMDDNMIKYWYPVLFGFYDIIMNGDDLEVRRLALDSLFSTLKTYGRTYPLEFWDTVCQELLFPIFSVLKSSQDLSRFSTQEDMSVWLSTTMIQALRDLIDLYTFYFDILERSLDGLLDLLCVCICQENDTLARIGTSCLQQLLENNVSKLSAARWERVVTAFVKLFRTTTPHQLFDESLRGDMDGNTPEIEASDANGQTIIPAPLSPSSEDPPERMSAIDRKRIFKQIIVKCVLQLLLIEMTNDLLQNEEVYSMIPPDQLLRLMGVLDHSYQFARMFNDDKELRTSLWKVGFMKHLPNLLKQESGSAATLVHILLKMYYDPRPDHQGARGQIADRLLPLSLGVIKDYNKLRLDSQGKSIIAWTPVVAEILDGFCRFEDKTFLRYMSAVYPLIIDLLSRDLPPEIRLCIRTYFIRVGYTQGILEPSS